MIRSMTGYGRAESVLVGRKISVELKSVNHRYLEISLRLPGLLLSLESEIKKRIGEQCSRGRIEATVRIESDGNAETSGRYILNLPLAHNYHALLCQLNKTRAKRFLAISNESSTVILAMVHTPPYRFRKKCICRNWEGEYSTAHLSPQQLTYTSFDAMRETPQSCP